MTWYPQLDYSVPAGPVTAASSPGALGPLIDSSGVWQVNASGQLFAPGEGGVVGANQLLFSTAYVPTDYNTQLEVDFYNTTANDQGIWTLHRLTNPGSGQSGYVIGISSTGFRFYSDVGGVTTQLTAPTAVSTATGTTYRFVTSVAQSGSSTVLSAALYQGATLIGSATYTDGTAALQNVNGQTGIYQSQTAYQNTGITQLILSFDYQPVAISWSPNYTYAVPDSVAAAGTPGALAPMVDATGNYWSSNSSGQLVSAQQAPNNYTGRLVFPAAFEPTDYNSQIELDFTYTASPVELFTTHRGSNLTSSSGSSGYIVGFSTLSGYAGLRFFSCVNDVATLLLSAPFSLVVGTAYKFVSSVVQSGASTILSAAIYSGSGALLWNASCTDSTAALQNVNGLSAIHCATAAANYNTGISNLVLSFDTAAVPATGYTISIPTAGLVGSPQPGRSA